VYSGINLTNGERMAVKEVVLNPGKRHKQQVGGVYVRDNEPKEFSIG
jgi:hypothetical protein